MNNLAFKIPVAEVESLRMPTELGLWFTTEGKLELIKTTFKCQQLPKEILAVRGKTAGAYSTGATFQWTSAVQSLSVLLLKAVYRSKIGERTHEPLLEGGKGSMAASLDASLYKQTAWLSDVFGANSNGEALSKRILLRTNPGRRRFGPVMVSLNEHILPASSIQIYLDNRLVSSSEAILECSNRIETQWQETNASTLELATFNAPVLYNHLWRK